MQFFAAYILKATGKLTCYEHITLPYVQRVCTLHFSKCLRTLLERASVQSGLTAEAMAYLRTVAATHDIYVTNHTAYT
jgi:hypothetical protein